MTATESNFSSFWLFNSTTDPLRRLGTCNSFTLYSAEFDILNRKMENVISIHIKYISMEHPSSKTDGSKLTLDPLRSSTQPEKSPIIFVVKCRGHLLPNQQ